MRVLAKVILGVSVVIVGAVAAFAQPTTTVTDSPGPMPDPTHIPFTLPTNVKWTGDPTKQQVAILFGNPDKPGIYGVLYKWMPGNFSRPHFHDQDRFVYVVSGTWWVSTSNVFDERTTYPLHAGTVSEDVANTVHWDGARTGEKEPAILELVGMGPVKTIQVGTDGKPLPPRPARAQ